VAEKDIVFEAESPGTDLTRVGSPRDTQPRRIFVLSPANVSGIRSKMLFNPHAQFDLALRIRRSGASLGEVYSFVSGLYFRGKLRYAETFGNPPRGVSPVHIITPAAGLVLPSALVTLADLENISAAPIDPSNRQYRESLDRDALLLRKLIEPSTDVVLLGSVATPKYVEPLLEIFGERLLFPIEFVGRGNMSRGSLLLRRSSEGHALEYAPVARVVRHGKRPAKLAPNLRSRSRHRD
jgi:hypothetical protein